MSKIPLVDLKAQYLRYRDEFDAAVAECIGNTAFIGGAPVAAFSAEFAEFCGGGHVATCNNGTDALMLAISAILGPGKGEGEIILPSHTFFATAEAVAHCGYKPTFIDVTPDTALMDVAQIEAAITPRTRAIMPVHLYGQMVPMQPVFEIANKHGLPVIEDAAQAHGAVQRWPDGTEYRPGSHSAAACFSFYPGKNLGAWGDGGAVLTQDAELAKKITRFANHGAESKYVHVDIGLNSRLDGLQAAVLRVKLRHLAQGNAQRREIAAWYDELVAEIPGAEPIRRHPANEHVYHLYIVRVSRDRDDILKSLNDQGIGAGIHYPIPCHEQPAFAHLNVPPESLPISHGLGPNILSLPIFPELTRAQAAHVAAALKHAMAV